MYLFVNIACVGTTYRLKSAEEGIAIINMYSYYLVIIIKMK